MAQTRSSQSRALTQMEVDDGNPVLPLELITSILILLPVKSLIRFQCVCKEWKTLFKTPSFIAEHLQHSTHQNPFLMFEDVDIPGPYRVCLLNRERQVLEVESDPFVDSIRHVCTINSCNGLICLGLANIPRYLYLLVWNPAIREVRLVSTAVNYCGTGRFYVGFGFSSTVDVYNIVKIRVSRNDYRVYHVEVYSLNIGTWKEVESGNLDGVAITSNGLSFNGAIFCVGSKLGADSNEDYIVSFDIATELFTLIPSPPLPFSISNKPYGKHLTPSFLPVLNMR